MTAARLRVLLVVAVLSGSLAGSALAAPRVNLVKIDGSINPASADYIVAGVEQSERDGADALLIELDTPGGLVTATKDIIQAILNSKVPVIVYVAPRGAWAASAGMYITVSAHVAAMAPSSTIGAAHPVSPLGGNEAPASPTSETQEGEGESESSPPAVRDLSAEKAENLLSSYIETIAKEKQRNVEWVEKAVRESVAVGETEALELGVIDVVAKDREDLFEQIEGREVDVDGETMILSLSGARVVPVEMSLVQRVFDFLADPNVAIILVLLGGLGLYIEANNPGLLFPGIAGLVCLVLAMIAFNILPFSWVGLTLMVLGLGFFVAELFFASFGALFVVGALCLLLGGSMVFDQPELNDLTISFWSVLVPAVLGMTIFAAVVVFSVGRSMVVASASGVDEIIGLTGQSASRLDPKGKVFVRGEYWNVELADPSAGPVDEGEPVQVVAVDGLTLRVRRPGSS